MKNENEKDWQLGKSRMRRVSNAWRNQAGILDKIRSPIAPHYTQD